MDPRQKEPVSRHAQSVKAGSNPPLNQPNSDSSGRTLKQCLFSCFRVGRGCHGKGSSHSGFLSFSSRNSILDPFLTFPWIRCQKGPDPGSSGVRRVRIRVKRAIIQSISGPGWPEGPTQQGPGSIQHLLLASQEQLWLPGQDDRRYGNRAAASLLRHRTTRALLSH